MTNIFVYGTLKRNFRLHRVLEGSTFLGEFLTKDKFHLFSAFEDGGFPVAMANGTHRVKGEIFQITNETLKTLNMIERGYMAHPVSVENFDEPVLMYISQYGPEVLGKDYEMVIEKYSTGIVTEDDVKSWQGDSPSHFFIPMES